MTFPFKNYLENGFHDMPVEKYKFYFLVHLDIKNFITDFLNKNVNLNHLNDGLIHK